MKDDYFTDQYALSEDPWGFESRWYERRKRDLTMAVLPRPRYRSALEPGCSVGMLTELLLTRCEQVHAWDLIPQAVERARRRNPGASIEVGDLRGPWPPGTHDLVVLSEVLYYLDEPDWAGVLSSLQTALAEDGHVVAVHWRHPVADYPMTGDQADARLRELSGLSEVGCYRDEDFVCSVLASESDSVARVEGLI